MKPRAELTVTMVPTDELVMYEGNAKLHPAEQVDQIAASIEEFNFADPVAAWHDDNGDAVIVEGHGRLLAARKLGIEELPVIFLDYLSDEQRKAYTLVHNQLTMNSGFDIEILKGELDAITDIDMSQFDVSIDMASDWFEAHERNDTSRQEGNEEYNEFLDKFEAKKTTDDCYTPDLVYDAVLEWVRNEYGVPGDAEIVRPFYPNGDYQRERYPKGCVVVDNPPFSILTEILRFYAARGIKFFLFAPTLTLFTGRGLDICYLPVGVGVTYENGASVNTSFISWKDGSHWFAPTRKEHNVIDDMAEIRKMDKAQLLEMVEALMFKGEETDAIRDNKPQRNADHPTMKPVTLFARLMRNSTRRGETVLDTFAGSGTTAIACEQMGRVARMAEIDEGYCDVILERWERFTGKAAALVGTVGKE